MKIGYFADGPWGHKTFDLLLARKDVEVCFLTTRFDHRDPVLIEIAHKNKIPVVLFENVNSTEAIEKYKKFGADLFVSMSFNQIIKKELESIPAKGFINCHAGKLPQYRGRNILNWAILNGEKEFGVTVHYIDQGIDTGDIILQKIVPIEQKDDFKSVYHKAIEVCPQLLNEAISLIILDKVQRKSQKNMGEGFYCARRLEGDEYIDWNWPTEKILNFIRGLTFPSIGATTFLNLKPVKILKASRVNGNPLHMGGVGQVVGQNEKGVLVKTGDGAIQIELISKENGVEQIPKFKLSAKLESYFEYRMKVLEGKIIKNQGLE